MPHTGQDSATSVVPVVILDAGEAGAGVVVVLAPDSNSVGGDARNLLGSAWNSALCFSEQKYVNWLPTQAKGVTDGTVIIPHTGHMVMAPDVNPDAEAGGEPGASLSSPCAARRTDAS